jgi:HD-GYP domain-containing protein (c-di-GMP phosphodiesterase class II)
MYVVETGLPKSDNPHVYSQEGEIENTDQIEQIVSEGYLDAFIDSNKGSYFKNNPQEKEKIIKGYEELSKNAAPTTSGVRNLYTIKKNLQEAEAIYDNSIEYVKNFIDDLKSTRKIDISRAEEHINSIIEHVSDNIDTLLFVSKLKTYDKYTYTHNLNVSIFSIAFASALGLGQENIKILGLSGLFHDIGKLLIDQSILNKPGKLSPHEFEEIKKHPALGYDMLCSDHKILKEVCMATLEHHEKYAGGGYPRDLNASQISKQALLISMVDVFDALTSDRTYKNKIHLHKALSIIFNLKGASFNPSLVDRFIKFLGIYPVGSIIILNNGRKAIVTEQNYTNLLRPKIRIVMDEKNRYCKVQDIDLLNDGGHGDEKLEIIETLGVENCRINVSNYLY